MKNFCPKCGTVLKENALFCGICGQKLDSSTLDKTDAVPSSPETTSSASSETMQHTQPLPRFLKDIPPAPTPKNRTGLYIGLGAAAGVLLAGIAIAILLLSGPKAEKSPAKNTAAPTKAPAPVATSMATQTPGPRHTVTPSPNTDLQTVIASIQTRYYAAQDAMPSYHAEQNGTQTKYYAPDGSLARVDTTSEIGGDSYYYDHGKLYFVFSYEGDEENRFYFDGDKLVRWIFRCTPAEEVYESPTAHPNYSTWEGYWLSQSEGHKASVMYRVRKSVDDAESQIGAFEDLENAKNAANSNAGYKVYTMYGDVVYVP